MKKMNIFSAKSRPFVIILVLIVLFSAVLALPFYSFDKRYTNDVFVNWRNPGSPTTDLTKKTTISQPNKKANKNIEIIGIQQYDIDKIGRYPWPRDVYEKIFNYFLDENGNSIPSTIFFDIAFLDKIEGQEEIDAKVAEAIKKNNNVILEYYLEYKTGFEKKGEKKEIENYIKNNFTISLYDAKYKGKTITNENVKNLNIVTFADISPTLKTYAEAGKFLGCVQLVPDADKKYRKLPLIYRVDDRLHFHAVVLMLCDYFGITLNDIDVDIGKAIILNNIQKNFKNKKLTIPIDENGFLYIDFIGNSSLIWPIRNAYDSYEEGRTSNKYYKNKLVFFGIYSLGSAQDVWFTPAGYTYGVEYIALAANQILNQSFYKFLSWWMIFLIILIVTFVLGYFFYKLPIVRTYALAALSLIVYILIAYILYTKYIFIPVSVIVVNILVLLISTVVYRILSEEKEKKFIRATFSNFVSKVVVDELLKHPEKIKLGGDNKPITVLFSDIRDFTSRSEQMKAEEVVDLLNKYLSRMTDIIFKFHGTLDKYIGDAIMAFWGAPIPQEDHALLASCTALEMTRELQRLNEELPKELQLDIGIGLNTGEVIVGNMGSASRMDYTLIGDVVNTGSRLEGVNKHYKTRIIISEHTHKMIKDYFYTRLVDRITAKGKSIALYIYEIIDYKEDFNPQVLIEKYNKAIGLAE